MKEIHTGIVLRAHSQYKRTLTLFDEQLGKIECVVPQVRRAPLLFHGALISYSLKKTGTWYKLIDAKISDIPEYLVREHFLFFHHVLELSDYFLQWDQQAPALFHLLRVLYTDPEVVGTKKAQKVFLCHFFKRLGIYPEEGTGPFEKQTIEGWLRACIDSHPKASSLSTVGFLKTLDLHEELA